MAVDAWQGPSTVTYSTQPLEVIPLGLTTVASHNPNNYPVFLTVAGGAVTVININGVGTGQTSGTFLVNAYGAVILNYTGAPTTFVTSLALQGYPFCDAWFQNFTVQQYANPNGYN